MTSIRSSIISFNSAAADNEDDGVGESDAISLADHDAISWADNEEAEDTQGHGKPLLRKYSVMDICVFFFFFFCFFLFVFFFSKRKH